LKVKFCNALLFAGLQGGAHLRRQNEHAAKNILLKDKVSAVNTHMVKKIITKKKNLIYLRINL
jgi:hypothetical protein